MTMVIFIKLVFADFIAENSSIKLDVSGISSLGVVLSSSSESLIAPTCQVSLGFPPEAIDQAFER